VFPKSRGGQLSWENCVAASFEINNMKRNRTPEEFGINLPKMPSMPKWTIFHNLPSNFSMPDSWKNFIKQ
jgi:5-methylcytosine-specific restriction endonuclease McrA